MYTDLDKETTISPFKMNKTNILGCFNFIKQFSKYVRDYNIDYKLINSFDG